MSGLNTHLNAFLALLEDRPEAARTILGSLPTRLPYNATVDLQNRIHAARENVKCDGAIGAIRCVFNEILKIEPPTYDNVPELNRKDLQDAYLAGAQRVETLLAQALETCLKTKRDLGPPA